MNAIECLELCKNYNKVKAINNISLTINAGEIYGLIGKNGAGKTTLLKMLSGITNQTTGKIKIFDKDRSKAGRIGAMIDGVAVYSKLTGRQNLKMFATLLGIDKKDIDTVLKKVNLYEKANCKVNTYSLGMKQRLGLAMALLGNPQIVILDEPFNGLDPVGVRELCDLIVDINKKEKKTFIISSHMLNELRKISTKYGFIENGVLMDEFNNDEEKATDLEEYFLRKVGYTYE